MEVDRTDVDRTDLDALLWQSRWIGGLQLICLTIVVLRGAGWLLHQTK